MVHTKPRQFLTIGPGMGPLAGSAGLPQPLAPRATL